MPTFERGPRFDREFRRLSRELQRSFLDTLALFIAALRAKPPAFPPQLRVKRVQGTSDVWELTFAPDGRATFTYGPEQIPGEPHIVWRRIGDHSILNGTVRQRGRTAARHAGRVKRPELRRHRRAPHVGCLRMSSDQRAAT